jgi:RNA polymerase sigma-70 factor (ECF subfamily)
MTRNISLSRFRYRTAQMRDRTNEVAWEEVADFIADDEMSEYEFARSELTDLLEQWLWMLDEHNRYIFLRRYWYMEDISTIAACLRMSEAAVYLRLDRMKKKLKAYLSKKGVLV